MTRWFNSQCNLFQINWIMLIFIFNLKNCGICLFGVLTGFCQHHIPPSSQTACKVGNLLPSIFSH